MALLSHAVNMAGRQKRSGVGHADGVTYSCLAFQTEIFAVSILQSGVNSNYWQARIHI